jgi:hypothetical protein
VLAVWERREMKYLVRVCLIAVLLSACAIPSGAQEQFTARPDGWRGLVIDASTPEDAIRVLGQPSGDKSNQSLKLVMVDKWLAGGKYNQKIFRELTFKKPAGFKEARLSFLENKLVVIELEATTGDAQNWLDPDELAATFNTKFAAEDWHFGKKLPPLGEFEQSLGNDSPKKFTEFYDMIAVSERSFIVATVDNRTARPMGLFTHGCSSCAKRENREKKERDAGGTFPGQVSFIEIVSRNLGGEGSDARK